MNTDKILNRCLTEINTYYDTSMDRAPEKLNTELLKYISDVINNFDNIPINLPDYIREDLIVFGVCFLACLKFSEHKAAYYYNLMNEILLNINIK